MPAAPAAPSSRLARAAPLALTVLFVTLGKLGEGLAPRLLDRRPLLLLCLNANDVLCGLAGPRLPARVFFPVVLARRTVEDFSWFALGRAHGYAALELLQRAFPGAGASFRNTLERLARSPGFELAAVAAWPSAPSCLAAGATRGSSPLAFLAVTLVCGALRAAALRAAGAHVAPGLSRALQSPAFAFVAAAAAAVSLALALRKLLSVRTRD
jgi:hypothetical protein